MSIYENNSFCEINEKSLLNSSTAKMKYSFPKSQRLVYYYGKNSSKQFLYNLPDVSNHRGTSLGYGKKTDFTIVEDYKKANIYDTRNNLDINKPTPCYTFGISRNAYDKVVNKI
jgi:hypothetical protein